MRGRALAHHQRVLAKQWHLVRLHGNIFCAWRQHAHKLQASIPGNVSSCLLSAAFELLRLGTMQDLAVSLSVVRQSSWHYCTAQDAASLQTCTLHQHPALLHMSKPISPSRVMLVAPHQDSPAESPYVHDLSSLSRRSCAVSWHHRGRQQL